MQIAALFSFSVLLAAGQVAFKFAANDITARAESMAMAQAILSAPLFFALVLYALATALWVWILSSTPLSQAYPFVLIGAVIVPVAARFVFSESLSATYPLGFLLVCVGVYLCVR